MKKVGFVKDRFFRFFFFDFFFFQIYVIHRCKKTGLTGFPEKRVPTKVEYLLEIRQI